MKHLNIELDMLPTHLGSFHLHLPNKLQQLLEAIVVLKD
jgi:hypothetical protein